MQILVRLTAITLIPLLAACGDAQPAPKANPLQISTITVGQEAPAEAIEAAGTAALRREIPLGFTTPGQIARITVQEGDVVRRGQVLATLDMTSVDASLEAADAERDRAGRNSTGLSSFMRRAGSPRPALKAPRQLPAAPARTWQPGAFPCRPHGLSPRQMGSC